MAASLQALFGIVALLGVAWVLSENRRALDRATLIRLCFFGIVLQLVLALLFLRVPAARQVFAAADGAVAALQRATDAGMQFVFGYLAGAPTPFEVTKPQYGFTLAFRALPLILIMSVLSRLLYHWGILQRVVAGFAWCLERAFGVSGPVGTAAAANVFVGMVEAPLLIRPYLASMGRGALFVTMTVGMATVAGTVMALYAAVLEPTVPGAAGHIIVASLMSVPSAFVVSRLMVPDGFTGEAGPVNLRAEAAPATTMEAIAKGTSDGIQLLAYVVAMLVVMVALVALANMILGAITAPFGLSLTLERMLGWLAAPFAWAIGIPWTEAQAAGALVGIKVVLNELIAYLELAKAPAGALSERSRVILTYALCGFANLGSLGIMVGGMTAMVPERAKEIATLGARSVIAGTLATLLTAAIVGLVV
jgi:CNT family concentrative nucleoside transporter